MDLRQPLLSHAAPAARTRGVNLLEMTFTLGITCVVMMTLYGFLMTQAMVTLEEHSELRTQNDTRLGAQQLIEELEMCKPRRLDSMGAWFQYYLPKVGTNGGYELDPTGSLIFGVSAEGVWHTNGYNSVAFVRSNESFDLLKERELALTVGTGQGTDLNGNGTMDDIFIGGYLVISTYDANGTPLGQPRYLTGKFFLQLDPAAAPANITPINPNQVYDDADSQNLTTFKSTGIAGPEVAAQNRVDKMRYKGLGIFLIRQVNGVGAQKADSYLDNNSNGLLDTGEIFTDTNTNQSYDEADSEPFVDSNGNNIKDALETSVDANHNGKYDCRMTIQLMTFDGNRKVTESGQQRDSACGLKVSRTKIRFKNL